MYLALEQNLLQQVLPPVGQKDRVKPLAEPSPVSITCLHHLSPPQVAEVASILDFLSTQTALPIVGISGGSAIVIPYKVGSPAGEVAQNLNFTSRRC